MVRDDGIAGVLERTAGDPRLAGEALVAPRTRPAGTTTSPSSSSRSSRATPSRGPARRDDRRGRREHGARSPLERRPRQDVRRHGAGDGEPLARPAARPRPAGRRGRVLWWSLIAVSARNTRAPQPPLRRSRRLDRVRERLDRGTRRTSTSGWLPYAALLAGLYLVAHLVARVTVPDADPTLLPLVGAPTARRPDGDLPARRRRRRSGSSSGSAVGVVAFALVLVWLRCDYRVLERYKYLFGISAVVLLLLPSVPGLGTPGQRREALGRDRPAAVPAGRAREDLPDHLPRGLPARQARGARAAAA